MWVVFSLLAAVTAAVAIVLSKAGLKDTDSSLGFAIQSVMIIILSWGVVLWQKTAPELSRIDRRSWIFLLVAGLATAMSSLFTFRALKGGDAALVSSLERLSLVFSVVLAVIFLKEELNWKVIVGAVLMLGGAVLISLSRSGQ